MSGVCVYIRYGRVSTCSISFVLQFIFNLALAFSPNVIVYLVFRFLSAFFDQLYYTALVMGKLNQLLLITFVNAIIFVLIKSFY